MKNAETLDSREVLVWYSWLSLGVGVVCVVWQWPMPAAFATLRIDPSALWSFILFFTASAAWLSGWVALGLSRIEEPIARRRALRCFGWTIALLPVVFFLNGYRLGLAERLPSIFAWGPLAVGFGMAHLVARARHRQVVPSTLALRPTVIRDKPTLRGRFEASILAAARQEERTRLARDLHDAVKQQLFVIQTAAATVDTRFDNDPPGARMALVQVRESAREALTEMEVMLEQLQASPLGNSGLIESLKHQCDVLKFRTGAQVTFEAGSLPDERRAIPGTHQVLLRFAQEALANVARHARAQHVSVTLVTERDCLVLAVTDDGHGFDPKRPPTGIGLGSMAARAAEVDGTFEVKSAPGAGTTVRLIAPTQTSNVHRFGLETLIVSVLLLGVVLLSVYSPRPYWAVLSIFLGAGALRAAISWWRSRR